MHEMITIIKNSLIDTTHEEIMIAQKHKVQIILDVECYDDLDLMKIEWSKMLKLEGDETVDVEIKELSNLY